MEQAFITDQREKGWTDFHPEDYCHQCGRPNIKSWSVDAHDWNLAVRNRPDPLPEILCPPCFAQAWEQATEQPVTWHLTAT